MNLDKTGQLIADTRKEMNMTQRALAEKLGVSDKAVSKWERGLSFPDIGLLQPISRVLGLSLVALISGEQSEKEVREAVADIVDDAVVISNSELKRKKKQYLRRMILIGVCIFIGISIVCIPFLLAMQPADSQFRVNKIQAQTYPSKHVLTLPINTKTNPGDFSAYGFMVFSSKSHATSMRIKIEDLYGVENVTRYHSLGSEIIYSRLLIRQQQQDGTIDYYALISTGSDGKKSDYVFTGMRYRLNNGHSDPDNIILPMHLLSDIRICERNATAVVSGAEYELHPISIDNGEYDDNYFELFCDFYTSMGWFNVETNENAISITPKINFDDAVALTIKFTEHSGQAYFSVHAG